MASVKPPAPPRTKSGEHPAVQSYRKKLESIAEHEGKRLDELNSTLAEYLEDTRSIPPPPPDNLPRKP